MYIFLKHNYTFLSILNYNKKVNLKIIKYIFLYILLLFKTFNVFLCDQRA